MPKEERAVREKHIRALWFDRRFDTKSLRTMDGQRLRIGHPGQWNLKAGPDFLNAHLAIGGRSLQGDVEIHLRPADWKSHGHHLRRDFNRVILHVVLDASKNQPRIFRQDGRPVPQLFLKPFLRQATLKWSRNFDPGGYPFVSKSGIGQCGKTLARLPGGAGRAACKFLTAAGEARLALKAACQFHHSLSGRNSTGLSNAFYQAWVESLGYKDNQESMRRLAKLIPLRNLKAICRRHGKKNRQACMEKVVLKAAGRLRWRLYQVRPAHHPLRRLQGFCKAVSSILPNDPLEALIAWGKDLGTKANLSRAAAEIGSIFGSPPLLGETWARTFLANVALPTLLAHSWKSGDRHLAGKVLWAYNRLPALPTNQLSRLMAHRLLGSITPNSAIQGECRQQGLLQIMSDFCDPKDPPCRTCRLTRIISQLVPASIYQIS